MGADLSQEQLNSLEQFRETVVSLIDISLTHTTQDQLNISVQRLRVCRDQVDILTPFMLAQLAKVWKATCADLHANVRQSKDAVKPDHFLEEFVKLDLSLPNGGSPTDIYDIVKPLHDTHKIRIMHLFLASVDHIDNARLDEH